MNVRKIHLSILIGILLTGIVFFSCDKATSIIEGDQYQQKEYDLKAIDTVACDYLSDTLATYIPTDQLYPLPGTWVTDPAIPNNNWVVFRDTQWVNVRGDSIWTIKPTDEWIILPDSSYLIPIKPNGDTTWVEGNDSITVYGADWNLFGDKDQLASVREQLIPGIVGAIDDLLSADTIVVKTNRHNALLTPAGQEENITVFNNSNAGNYVVYIDDYIDLKLFNTQGEEMSTTYNQIPFISTTGCYEAKTRQEYTLDPGNYLLQAMENDQTMDTDTLNVVIMQDEQN